MKRMLLAMAIALAVMIVTLSSVTQPASAQDSNLVCVEAHVNASAKRRGTRTDCNFRSARTEAIRRARANASAALSATCLDAIRFLAQRASECERQGLRFYDGPFRPIGRAVRARESSGNIDGSLQLNATHCTVLRDLPNEYSSTTVPDGFCFPFIGGEHTTFIARSRTRCGVICQPL